MTRFAAAVVCGPALLVSTAVGLAQGNPLAWGLAIGFAAPLLAAFLLIRDAAKPLPRKADPAKIARLERELGLNEPPLTYEWLDPNGTWHPAPSFEAACTEAARRWAACDPPAMTRSMVRNAEASTTAAHRPPDPIPGVENIARP